MTDVSSSGYGTPTISETDPADDRLNQRGEHDAEGDRANRAGREHRDALARLAGQPTRKGEDPRGGRLAVRVQDRRDRSRRAGCAPGASRSPRAARAPRNAMALKYGADRAKRSSDGSAANAHHSVAIFRPISGICDTQSGGGGTENRVSDLDHARMSSVRSAMPMTAVVSGAAMIEDMTSVMAATARPRLPQSAPGRHAGPATSPRRSSWPRSPRARTAGAPRSSPDVKPPMVITPRTIRVRSQLRTDVFTPSMAFPSCRRTG